MEDYEGAVAVVKGERVGILNLLSCSLVHAIYDPLHLLQEWIKTWRKEETCRTSVKALYINYRDGF